MSHQRLIVLVVFALALMLTACAPSVMGVPASEPAVETVVVEAQGETIIETVAIMPEAEDFAEEEAPSSGDSDPAIQDVAVGAQQQERLIIKRGEITIRVDDVGEALEQVTGLAAQYGGYVIGSTRNADRDVETASIRIAVRVENYETALQDVRILAHDVIREESTGEDVTDEYVDLESRLRNLEATRDRVRGFLEEAETVDDALDVNRELSRLDEEIEVILGRMQFLEQRATFSTIRVVMRERTAPAQAPTATPPADAWDLGETARDALTAQNWLLRNVVEAVIWLALVPGPYFLVFGLVAFGVRTYLVRRRRGGTN